MAANNLPRLYSVGMAEMDRKYRKYVDDEFVAYSWVLKAPRNVTQVQPHRGVVMSATTEHLPSDKPFPFLRLPAEVRNMVYQYGVTYVPEAHGICHDSEGLPSLQQPPITRVNRQLRQECLQIFYEMFRFSFELNVRAWEVVGEKRAIMLPASDDEASLQSLHEMIRAFAPGPNNTLRTSNLRYLTSLTIHVNLKAHAHDEFLGCIGFHVTSADEVDYASLGVRGLDWTSLDALRWAWVAAAKDSSRHWDDSFEGEYVIDSKLGYFEHRELVEEMLNLLRLLAGHCPQLTKSVSLFYDGPGLHSGSLYDLAMDEIGLQYWDDMIDLGYTPMELNLMGFEP